MSAVIVSMRVNATPEQAFDAFVNDIGFWWRPHPLFPITPDGSGTLTFEGRQCLVATSASGQRFEIGEISEWVRGERLALSWRPPIFGVGPSTFVEVRFEAIGAQTRVTVEHRAPRLGLPPAEACGAARVSARSHPDAARRAMAGRAPRIPSPTCAAVIRVYFASGVRRTSVAGT